MTAERLGVAFVILLLVLPAMAQTPGWLIDYRSGCLIWTRAKAALDSVTWSGDCVNGLASGTGAIGYLSRGNGIWWGEGTFIQGVREGRGWLANLDGDKIEGDFRAGEIDGHAVFTSSDGTRFEGEYRGNKRHGEGTMTFGDNTYVGEWRNDRPDGKGTFTGSMTGAGVSTWSGLWVDGCFRDGERRAWLLRTAEECGF